MNKEDKEKVDRFICKLIDDGNCHPKDICDSVYDYFKISIDDANERIKHSFKSNWEIFENPYEKRQYVKFLNGKTGWNPVEEFKYEELKERAKNQNLIGFSSNVFSCGLFDFAYIVMRAGEELNEENLKNLIEIDFKQRHCAYFFFVKRENSPSWEIYIAYAIKYNLVYLELRCENSKYWRFVHWNPNKDEKILNRLSDVVGIISDVFLYSCISLEHLEKEHIAAEFFKYYFNQRILGLDKDYNENENDVFPFSVDTFYNLFKSWSPVPLVWECWAETKDFSVNKIFQSLNQYEIKRDDVLWKVFLSDKPKKGALCEAQRHTNLIAKEVGEQGIKLFQQNFLQLSFMSADAERDDSTHYAICLRLIIADRLSDKFWNDFMLKHTRWRADETDETFVDVFLVKKPNEKGYSLVVRYYESWYTLNVNDIERARIVSACLSPMRGSTISNMIFKRGYLWNLIARGIKGKTPSFTETQNQRKEVNLRLTRYAMRWWLDMCERQ